MLPSEEFFGNIEYKQSIINKDNNRLQELATQLNFRLNEGNGISTYFLGVNDNGSISNISLLVMQKSLSNLRYICNIAKAKITNIKTLNKYCKITIYRKITKEKSYIILLLGPSRSGKTSFLSNLLKRQIGANNKIFMMKHKHEIETGKTSSFNYHRFKFNKINYIFIDTPGDNKYIKTTNKIINQSRFNLVLMFYKKNNWKLEKYYQKLFYNRNTKVLRINYLSNYNYFTKYNNLELINRKDFFKNLKFHFSNIFENKENKIKKFNIISSTITDIGTIVTGFVEFGKFKSNDIIKYNNNKIKIKSIHFNEKEIYEITKNNYCSFLISNQIKIKKGSLI
tara:strand:- start:1503 stop:2519 length:1017 start_codon:yes stop_codon:yes gene_type:complete